MRAIASRQPNGSASIGGSLIDGPGNTQVRSAATLCVGAGAGGAQRVGRQPADIAVATSWPQAQPSSLVS